MEVQLYGGSLTLDVVGEPNYQDGLQRIVSSQAKPDHFGHREQPDGVRLPIHAVLVAETDNPYDANAVSVWVSGLKVGYLSRETAGSIRPGLLRLQTEAGKPIGLEGVIVGRPGLHGVFLNHDPEDFGLPGGLHRSIAPPSGSKMRTGFSAAVDSDDDDESYYLS